MNFNFLSMSNTISNWNRLVPFFTCWKNSYDFIIFIQWIWENSGKKVNAAKWQKSSKSNHRGDQGLGSKGIKSMCLMGLLVMLIVAICDWTEWKPFTERVTSNMSCIPVNKISSPTIRATQMIFQGGLWMSWPDIKSIRSSVMRFQYIVSKLA